MTSSRDLLVGHLVVQGRLPVLLLVKAVIWLGGACRRAPRAACWRRC